MPRVNHTVTLVRCLSMSKTTPAPQAVKQNRETSPSSAVELPEFQHTTDQKRLIGDKVQLYLRLAILTASLLKYGGRLDTTGFSAFQSVLFSIANVACLMWATVAPARYAAWRQPVMAALRLWSFSLSAAPAVLRAALQGADPWRHGGLRSGVAFQAILLFNTGVAGALLWALGARLTLPLHSVVQALSLAFPLLHVPSICSSQLMQHPASQAAVAGVFEFVDGAVAPITLLQPEHARTRARLPPSAQCWCVVCLEILMLGFVLPTVVVAVWECQEFHKFRAATGGRHRSDWRTWLYERTTAAPVEGGWVRGGKLAMLVWLLVGAVWDILKTMAAPT